MDDKKIALLELRRDPLFHRIPSNRYDYYIENSINIGKNIASQYKGMEIKKLYKEHGIKVSYSENGNRMKSFQLRAEFIQKEGLNEVVLYKNSLNQLVEAWNEVFNPQVKLTYSEVENIHLAHEFHHYLEYNIFSPVEKQLDPVTTKTLFGKKKEQFVRQCSEIACHSFAKEILQLDYFPTLLDLTFLFFKGELDSEIASDIFGYKTFKERNKK
ncbi:hypothetical protein FEZ48_02275 [Marinilactibacillus psychrotolerans]|uniref:Uncharacterized protein n=1 Tax=Marinilactibacillus psychrotolerans TaxID=191770 RepID=A0A5R9C758_9LACT|nr:hypothetical protein [Marinilactibacillus psychrotolerans]TLQ08999.1 hypothetical protein FEZ48_02275 [Marinilactibacillus psychrotolerans]